MENKKTGFLKCIIHLTGLVCLTLFIAAHVDPWGQQMIDKRLKNFGSMTTVQQFNVKLPDNQPHYQNTPKHPSLESADLLTIGDSFFEYNRQKTLPELLSDSINEQVFFRRQRRILPALARLGYQKGEKKVLIYELVERSIPLILSENTERINSRGKVELLLDKYGDLAFPKNIEARYAMLVQNSQWTYDLFSIYSTFKYNRLGQAPGKSSKYMESPPWLFYHQTTDSSPGSFYYQHTEKEINTYVYNLKNIQKRLAENYNLELVFMPIPNKYTIYHHLINDDSYNNFLPRLYKALEREKIPVIKTYTAFLEADEELYYGVDTHWNEQGVLLGLDLVIRFLKENNLLYLNHDD